MTWSSLFLSLLTTPSLARVGEKSFSVTNCLIHASCFAFINGERESARESVNGSCFEIKIIKRGRIVQVKERSKFKFCCKRHLKPCVYSLTQRKREQK